VDQPAESTARALARLARQVCRAPRLIAMALALALPLAFAVTGTAAATSVKPGVSNVAYFLSTGQVPIKADGHTWRFSGFVSGSLIEPGQAEVLAQITTTHLGGTENHDWSMTMPGKDFKASSAGKASVSSGSSLAPIATLSLSFKPSSHTKVTCAAGGSQTTYNGKLTGSIHLTTGLKHLTLSKRNATFSKPDTLQVSTDFCVPTPCLFASWSAGSPGLSENFTEAAGLELGRPAKLRYAAEFVKTKTLSAPKGTIRSDGALIDTATPRFSSSAKSLSVSTSRSGVVTGTAVLGHARSLTKSTISCREGGTAYTEKTVSYDKARYSSPSGHQIEAHTLLTGLLKLPRSGAAGWVILTSVKKK
jgi:hypothetical protein